MRETISITTPVGKQTLVLNSYITGREKRTLTNSYFGGSLEFDVHSENIKGLNPDAMDKAQEIAFKTVVISIDGKKDGENDFSLVDTILDMRAEDYDFVVKEVNKITSDKSFEQKKTT